MSTTQVSTPATRILAPFFLAGAAAAATIALAPTVGATSSADCNDVGPTAVCTRPGHAAIYATPGGQEAQQYLLGPGSMLPFGAGPVPPLMAFD